MFVRTKFKKEIILTTKHKNNEVLIYYIITLEIKLYTI